MRLLNSIKVNMFEVIPICEIFSWVPQQLGSRHTEGRWWGLGFSRIVRRAGQRGDGRRWPYLQEKSWKDGLRERQGKSDGMGGGLMDWRHSRCQRIASMHDAQAKEGSRRTGGYGGRVGFEIENLSGRGIAAISTGSGLQPHYSLNPHISGDSQGWHVENTEQWEDPAESDSPALGVGPCCPPLCAPDTLFHLPTFSLQFLFSPWVLKQSHKNKMKLYR